MEILHGLQAHGLKELHLGYLKTEGKEDKKIASKLKPVPPIGWPLLPISFQDKVNDFGWKKPH